MWKQEAREKNVPVIERNKKTRGVKSERREVRNDPKGARGHVGEGERR